MLIFTSSKRKGKAMKKLLVMGMLIAAGVTASAQVFSVTKHKGSVCETDAKRVSVYSNLFVNSNGDYMLRANSVSDANFVYTINLGDSRESAIKSLDVLSFFMGHDKDSMGVNYRMIADSVINVKDIELTARDIKKEMDRLNK